MALQDDKIKDLFSSKFSDFEPEVPASIWAGIDQTLSQQAPVQTPDASGSQVSGAATKSAVGLKATLATVGIAASLTVGVVLYNQGDDVFVETPTDVVEQVIVEESAKEEPLLAQVDENDSTNTFNAIPLFTPARSMSVSPKVEEQNEEAESQVVKIQEIRTDKEEKNTEIEEIQDVKETEEIEALSVSKFFKQDFSVSVKGSIGLLSSTINEKGGGFLFSQNDRSSAFGEYLKDENENYKLAHKQPISIGVTATKKLTDKFSLETGLMFTYLSSKITSTSSIKIEEKQTFGYLGIPIYINYEFYRLNKAKFYISLGAMMQKDIYGKYTSSFVLGDELLEADARNIDVVYAEPRYLKKNISQSNWQFSTHMNIGVTYPVYRRIYFYSQIGGAYYFDANNEYRTIYSDRKFQLDLNLGLRFDF